MATWQFTLFLVPAAELGTPGETLPARISVERLRAEDWWRSATPPEDLAVRLDAFLPRRGTWTSDMLGWGTDDGNRVDVLSHNGRLEEIQVRLDARDVDVGLIERLAELARYSQGVFITEEGEITTPTVAQLIRELESSTAHRFAVDPHVFLESLDQKEELP
jgi:hypothetical protein